MKGATATRNASDGRKATVRWKPARGAQFYIVRIGATPELMTQSFQVYDGETSVQINTLSTMVRTAIR